MGLSLLLSRCVRSQDGLGAQDVKRMSRKGAWTVRRNSLSPPGRRRNSLA